MAAAEPPLNQSLRVTDGKATATAVFDKPGVYVLRGYAEDTSMHTPHDVTVTVAAGSPAPPQR